MSTFWRLVDFEHRLSRWVDLEHPDPIFDGGSTGPRRWQNFKQTDPASMFETVSAPT